MWLLKWLLASALSHGRTITVTTILEGSLVGGGGAMAFLTAVAPREKAIVNFASLAILVPLFDNLDIANIIDRHLPTDPQEELSHGTMLRVLLAARLHQPTALVNVADWAAEHGVE